MQNTKPCASSEWQPVGGGEGKALPLRVAHVVLALDVGGLERNVINQVREGHGLGQSVSVVCLERPGTLASQVETLGGHLVCLDKRPGIRLELIVKIWAVLRKIRPDIVHTHQIGTLIYAGPAAHGASVPLVVHTEHGTENCAGRLRTRLLGRLAGRYAARFYCLSEDMAAQVRANRIAPRPKVHVIHNGIDMARFRERHDPDSMRRSFGIPFGAPVVGTVGRLNEIKRQDLLIRAFAEVRRRVPDAHLLLVGDGPLIDDLRALAASLELSESVHFAGYRPHSAPYLQMMDIFALTSRSEGTPQAMLEALVTGLPVIASRVGGIPEVIEDGRTGLLFKPDDEAALATGLVRLIADKDLARRLGEAGRSRVESTFDIRRMARDYHNHYLELLGALRGDQPGRDHSKDR